MRLSQRVNPWLDSGIQSGTLESAVCMNGCYIFSILFIVNNKQQYAICYVFAPKILLQEGRTK